MSKTVSDYGKPRIIEDLEKVKAFTSGFTRDDVEALAGVAEAEEYEPNEIVVLEDDTSRDIMIIVEGTAGIELKLTHNEDSSRRISKVRDYTVLGEVAFVDGSRRSATIRAIVTTMIIRLPYKKLYALCDNNRILGYKLMHNLAVLMAQRLRNANFEIRAHLYF
ncbi:MAG: hypothetical protein IEMM0002_0635 [bacterium]|nr:MAG: hypothetical protein IEMM0002_0635 [bacterium]